MARLIFIGDKFAGRVYEFALEQTSVGRGDHNTLSLHDASVSNSHCEILVFGPEVIVRDLGSSNGTSVNGVRLRGQQRPLMDGQLVKFGSVEARLELDLPSQSNTATDVTAFHSYARHVREQRHEPQTPPAVSMTLEEGAVSTPTGKTVVPPPPERVEDPFKTIRAQPVQPREIPRNRRKIVLFIAIMALGAAFFFWMIFGRLR